MKFLSSMLLASVALWCGCDKGGGTISGQVPAALKSGPAEAAKAELAKNPQAARIQDVTGNTALHYAAYTGKLELVKLLLEAKADVNVTNMMGQTVLHRAVNAENPEVTKAILEAGADLNRKDAHGRQPINLALASGHPAVVKLLIEKKADLNTRTEDGLTPFLVAAGSPNLELVELFLATKPNINDRDSAGNTALHRAAAGGSLETVKLLVDNQAIVTNLNKAAETPLTLVQSLKGISRTRDHNKIEDYLNQVTPAEFKKEKKVDIIAFPATESSEPSGKSEEKKKEP